MSRCSLHIWNANTSLQLHRPLLQKGSGALYSSMSMWVSWPSGVRTSQQIWSQFTAQQCAETYHLGCTDFWMWKQRPAKGLQELQAVNPWAYPYLTGETASWTFFSINTSWFFRNISHVFTLDLPDLLPHPRIGRSCFDSISMRWDKQM